MDNYRDHKLDSSDQMYCKQCGLPIDETQVFGEGTEFEQEFTTCESCFKQLLRTNRRAVIH